MINPFREPAPIPHRPFEVGDAVGVISGGPNMTVISCTTCGRYVTCIWFDTDDRYCEQTFNAKVLQFVDEDES